MSAPIASRILQVLACPACRCDLRERRGELECSGCGNSFVLQNGVPVFLSEPAEVVAIDHASNAIGPEFEQALRAGNDFILHIGAGGSPTRFPNCVEFEHKIFRHTDVVGDAHHLPFRDAIFDRVFALNVFEHLRDPKMAAAEILRVLKPGGTVAIHTAFLQSLHEAPHHYYNATEFGARAWFAGFEIQSCEVSGNFGPAMMLAFLISNVLDAAQESGMPPREQITIGSSSLGEWAEFWRHRNEPPPGFHALQTLPQALQSRVAAGFQLIARKPAESR